MRGHDGTVLLSTLAPNDDTDDECETCDAAAEADSTTRDCKNEGEAWARTIVVLCDTVVAPP